MKKMMATSVLYTNFGGMLVQEDRGGTVRTYAHDEMGNTSYLLDDSSVTDSYEYTPYGQVSHTGSNVTPFTFIGALGYFATGWSFLTSYVRARWYSNASGSWGSVDPIWPWQKAYAYVEGNPSMWSDSTGLLAPFFAGFGGGCFIGATMTGFNTWVSHIGGRPVDPAWPCKAGASCITTGLAAGMSAQFGWVGGCIGSAIGSILGKYLNDWCDCQWNPCCCDYSWTTCDVVAMLINSILACFVGYKINQWSSQGQGGLIQPWTLSNKTWTKNKASNVSRRLRSSIMASLGVICEEAS